MLVSDVTTDRLTVAVREYLKNFATPEYPNSDARHIVNGFLNDVSLPSDGNEIAVFTPRAMHRHGTTLEGNVSDDGTIRLGEYVEVEVQVDCYSASRYYAQQRAQTYEMVGRSSYGVAHFKKYGLDLLYVDDAQNLTSIMDSDQYVSRWMVTLHIGLKKAVVLQQDGFSAVSISADDIQNVDVKFPPK